MTINSITKVLGLALAIILVSCDNTGSTADNTQAISNTNSSLVDNMNKNISLNNTDLADDPIDDDYGTGIISEYAYIAAGNYIEMYKIESSGNLVSIGSVTPSGIPSTAKISSLTISPNHLNVYATVQNGDKDDKIWSLSLNAVNGRLAPLAESLISTKNSGISSIATSLNSQFIYTADTSKICTYQIIDNYGTLPSTPNFCISPLVNGKVYPYGQIKLSANGEYAFVSGGSSLKTIFTLKRESNGSLTYLSQLDTGVNNNLSMAIPESGGLMYTALKGNNAVGQYKIDKPSGKVSPLSPASIAAGSEPHAVIITPNREYAYVTNYNSNSISSYKTNADGTLYIALNTMDATVSAPGGPDKMSIDKSGRYVYVSTRDKHVLQYRIDYETGILTPLTNSAIPIWESGANIAVTNIAGLHMSLISPVYTHDVPLDAKYVIDLSNGYTESSIRTSGNIMACQIEESKYVPEPSSEMSVSTYSAGCPSGSSAVMVGDIFDLSPTQIAITFVGLIASHQVLIFLNNIRDSFGNTYPEQEFVLDTTVSYDMQSSPKDGESKVSTHSGIYFTFTKAIKTDSPTNKITITYGEGEEIEMMTLKTEVDGTTIGATAPSSGLPVGVVNTEAVVELTTGEVVNASGAFTTIEESQESKLIIYVAYGQDRTGYTGDLFQYDPVGHIISDPDLKRGYKGAIKECNASYNKPSKRSNEEFNVLLGRMMEEHFGLQANTPYYNEDEEFIATTSNRSIFEKNTSFSHPIYVGDGINTTLVWTAIRPGPGYDMYGLNRFLWNSRIHDCREWSSESGNVLGAVGDSMLTESLKAIDSSALYNCSERMGLYCVQIKPY